MWVGPAPDRQPVPVVKGGHIIKSTVRGISRDHNIGAETVVTRQNISLVV